MRSKYAFDKRNLKTMYEQPWKLAFPAFRVFGNLYFVGNQDGASWLVDSGDGLILFDTNYPTADTLLIDSIWSLGFNPRNIVAIFHTHGHFDHIFGADVLRQKYCIPLAIHEADGDMLCDPMKNASMLFFRESHIYHPAEKLLRDGDEIAVGTSTIRVMHTPGHSPGSVCYCMGKDCITGDTLFRESIGRTDLPGGNSEAISRSLEKLAAVADDIQIYPGHGETTIIGRERQNEEF